MLYILARVAAAVLFRVANVVLIGNLSPPISSAGVIRSGDKILAVNHHDGRGWMLPGGLVKLGETTMHTVEREVREETGITVRVGKQLGVFERLTGDALHIPLIQIAYVCTHTGGELHGSIEGTAAWVDPAELRQEADIVTAAR